MITIFTPSFADEANTNAQNLTVKEVVSRLPPDQFKVILLTEGKADARILARDNTEFLSSSRHGNTVRWLARVLRPDIDVYFFPRAGPLDSLFLHCRRWGGLRVSLVTYIVMALEKGKHQTVLSRAIREADGVYGNSSYVSQTISEIFGVRASTIYDGMRRDVFYPSMAARVGSSLTVLYAGSFQARKRVDAVIREAAKWPGVEFRLAGKGEEEAKLRALVQELGCKNVTFIGHVSQEGIAEEMRRADVFLFPSILEGHPQVLGQATACGLPSIAMKKYHPDYVVDGETGYLVESDNELSEKLALVLTDRERRLRMSTAAAQHALQFDWDRIAHDWANAFVDAADRRRRSRR